MFSRIGSGILALLLAGTVPSHAQVSDGSIAPDFTFTDITGKSHNLYTYLDSGQFVALEVSATWCEPCWEYHQQGVMDSLYEMHETGGQKNWKVFFIEGDKTTARTDLEGTGDKTKGNWLKNRSYTFIDPDAGEALSNFLDAYEVTFFPTLYLICPDRRVYRNMLNGTPRPDVRTWEKLASSGCITTGISLAKNELCDFDIYPNPVRGNATIRLSSATATPLSLIVTNTLGQVMAVKEYGYLAPENRYLSFSVEALKPGIYFFTLKSNQGASQMRKVVIQ